MTDSWGTCSQRQTWGKIRAEATTIGVASKRVKSLRRRGSGEQEQAANHRHDFVHSTIPLCAATLRLSLTSPHYITRPTGGSPLERQAADVRGYRLSRSFRDRRRSACAIPFLLRILRHRAASISFRRDDPDFRGRHSSQISCCSFS